ncbi:MULTISPECIES: tRNA-(ms[2]io[6]A)-hydroxylase [Prochlorococcus]|uniref:tRNA-(ms[2]io[6]A)-hydroxylase n=1 Tax=Prochlorococcus TaxID=1218 RepID=UPI000533BA24|nr:MULTISPECIES: tRNA-(ms[2]io[6]A)-hydroxylase [Prochlorococcus]KGG13012.1 tRNA-(ms(2)io(6)A)-hydroxylase [Prochlorococcus sp. MIT 0601]
MGKLIENYYLEPTKVKWLLSRTNDQWLKMAIANPIEVLVDHAHCERKAAGAAVQLMFRYLCEPGLAEVLSPLVREELEHFERVLNLLISRGEYLKPLPAPPYGALLAKAIRKDEPYRMLDSFLISGLIEARSHERMSLLAMHSPDPELSCLYSDLLESEARHFGIYWQLASERFNKETILLRIKDLAKIESGILAELHPEPRMHS